MERRSTFRFRLPWSQSAPAPAPTPANRPSTRPKTKTSSSPTTTPSSSPISEPTTRNQPPSITTITTSTKPSSPARYSAGTQARDEAPISTTTTIPTSPMPKPSAETKAPGQPSPTSTSPSPETPAAPPQPLDESKAPIQPFTTNSTPAIAPASPKFETQTPTAAITNAPTSTIAKNPPSTPPVVAPSTPSQTLASRTESQPLTPSLEQHGITSQPTSPSDVATKYPVSQPPLSSRSTPQTREMTPTPSPTRKGHEVLPTDQLTSKSPHPASQNSQPKYQTTSQPRSPPKELQESSESSSKSTETLPSSPGKEPKPTAIQPHSERLEHFKKETISDTVPEAKVRSPEKVTRPSELSEVKSTRVITEGPSQISDSSGIINEPKTVRQPDTNIKAAREVKEVVEETRDKNYGAAEKIDGFLTSKEQPSIVFQSKKAYVEKPISSDNDRIRVNPVSVEKTTRAVSSQPKNKTVVSDPSQKTAVSAEPDIPLHNEIKDNISNFLHRMAAGNGKHNLEERPVNVITLAGDNRGASMQLGSDSSRKEGAIHIHRGYKLNPDESADATTDAEGNSEGRRPKDARTMEDQEVEAYMNCNVQGLNNSIIFDSSIAVKSPGIYVSFPRVTSEPLNSSDNTGALEAHKAEYNVTPTLKLAYEPTIRRRCLRGLFHEPSDSDPDDPGKPRGHGCLVGGMGKSTENEIDIL